jgi:hypothetical protein
VDDGGQVAAVRRQLDVGAQTKADRVRAHVPPSVVDPPSRGGQAVLQPRADLHLDVERAIGHLGRPEQRVRGAQADDVLTGARSQRQPVGQFHTTAGRRHGRDEDECVLLPALLHVEVAGRGDAPVAGFGIEQGPEDRR